MPGFDSTGPMGQGAMTGRGLGPCGRGMAMRVGAGRGAGLGRGMGRGFYAASYNAPADDDRIDRLEEKLERMETLLQEMANKK